MGERKCRLRRGAVDLPDDGDDDSDAPDRHTAYRVGHGLTRGQAARFLDLKDDWEADMAAQGFGPAMVRKTKNGVEIAYLETDLLDPDAFGGAP
jgi:hypothetical protein